jgi:predicted MFS family arabinose efflux permease
VLSLWGATAAFTVAIAAVACAFAIFLSSGTLRLVKRIESQDRQLLGPLSEPRLLLVFTATFGLAVCFGLIEVGYPAFATAQGAPALAGLLLAINSVGSALGGMLFGGLHFRASVERQLAAAMALMSIPLLMHALFQVPLAFAIVAFFAGALIAPSITAQSVLVSRLAPSQYATEAFTWSSTFIVSGIGAGMALGGALVEHVSLRAAFGFGTVLILGMSLLVLTALVKPGTDPSYKLFRDGPPAE